MGVVCEAGLVMISGSSSSPSLTSVAGEQGPDWQPGFFRTAQNDALVGRAAAEEGTGDVWSRGERERLGRLGVETIGDLLCLVPLRYEDRTVIRPMGSLRAGQKVLVAGEIALSEVAYGRRRSLLARLSDGTGSITLRFFHFSRQQQAGLQRGAKLRCFGEVRAGPTGLEMVHPEYRQLGDADAGADDTLTPVYPTTEGLQQGRLRRLIAQALAVDQDLDDFLGDLLDADWPTLDAALEVLHRPPGGADTDALAARRAA